MSSICLKGENSQLILSALLSKKNMTAYDNNSTMRTLTHGLGFTNRAFQSRRVTLLVIECRIKYTCYIYS